jgi:hypothetical protein
VVLLAGETLCVPLVGSAPLQPSLAAQEDALVVDQVSVDEPPTEIVVALAVKVTVGVGGGADDLTVILVDV